MRTKDKTCAICGAMTGNRFGLCKECRPPAMTGAERVRLHRERKARIAAQTTKAEEKPQKSD